MKNKVVFFCGLKDCGKTYYAQKLSQETLIPWFDSDAEILRLNDSYSSCRELYKQVGETIFREKERQAIESIVHRLEEKKENAIVSLGGGVCNANNSLEYVKEHGIIVYLKELEHVLYNRMEKEGLPPYLKTNPIEAFHELYVKRDKVYSCFANYVVELYNWSENEVLNKLKDIFEELH